MTGKHKRSAGTRSKPEARLALGRARPDGEALFPVAPPKSELPSGYRSALEELKDLIQETRLRTVLSANAAMIQLYWGIGRTILERQAREGWGAKVVDRLSADLREAFPDMSGLSARNLKYMRAFAAAWPDPALVQRALHKLPWGVNLQLLDALDQPTTRLWYAEQAGQHGWSRDLLSIPIDRRVHERQGKVQNNFALSLPPGDSDLAAQIFKDPYLFDMLGTADPRREAEVAQALVVVELKAVPFEAAFVGQLNLYLSATDDLLKQPEDNPTIGLLLCRGEDKFVAEYALRDVRKPIGVADWATKRVEKLPKELEGSLPTIEQIEAELMPNKKRRKS